MLKAGMMEEAIETSLPACVVCTTQIIKAWKAGVSWRLPAFQPRVDA